MTEALLYELVSITRNLSLARMHCLLSGRLPMSGIYKNVQKFQFSKKAKCFNRKSVLMPVMSANCHSKQWKAKSTASLEIAQDYES